MIRHNVLVGSVTIIMCLLLLRKDQWFLANTIKGQRLIRWFGASRAPWVLRGLLLTGILFGSLLAIGVIRPIQW